MLINLTLDQFLAETASASPAPGGGSVSALVGALGAALAAMVCELTSSKEEAVLTQLAAARNEASRLQEELKQAVDRDTVVFNKVMTAYKLPKASEEEKRVRAASIQDALKAAADEPCRAAELGLEVLKQAVTMLQIGNRNAASDAAVSGLMAHAALHGALYNVRINIGAIKDETYTAAMRVRCHALATEADLVAADLKQLAAEVIG
ncbi:MAG: cyclodeaminase/cyclohydrolase family protein [Negativicutes bacterium]|nr:cyclodeaminase/cyclohydrolase family protein [Negativicutes bacterium]